MKHIFILNSYGKQDPYLIRNEIFKYCLQHNMDYEIVYNKNDNTENIVDKYSKDGNIIYAVGGDGMINRVLNRIVNTNATLGYIPYGTGNDLDRVIKSYDDGMIDLNVGKINDKYFINVACFGVDADISNDERFIHNDKIPKNMRYHMGALYHFLTYQPKRLEIEYNDGMGEFNNQFFPSKLYSTVAVCNSKYYGGGYKIAPNAKIDDSLFDVYFVDKLNRLELAKAILKMRDGRHENCKGIRKYMLDNMVIKSKDVIRANVDGELLESDVFNINFSNNIKIYNNQDLIKEVKKVLKK